jgi:hypothetical protein
MRRMFNRRGGRGGRPPAGEHRTKMTTKAMQGTPIEMVTLKNATG